jgi:hypothetical protein
MEVLSAEYIATDLRDIAEYKIRFPRTEDTLFVYSAHLKAGNPDFGGENEDLQRLAEVTILRNNHEYPSTITLLQNYPNPFNPATIINYELPITNNVELSVYNLLGQEVVTLVSKIQKAGHYQVEWDGSEFPSGVYLYILTAGKEQVVKKMMLLR